MEIKNEKILNVFNFLIANGSCIIFHITILVCLGISYFFIWLFSGNIVWALAGNSQFTSEIALIITNMIIALIYGSAWLVFWNMLYKDGIKWFYCRVVFSLIPLVLALLIFDPTPNSMAMIDMPKEPIFSCLVTGIILLPIYSVSIYKFILQTSTNRRRKTIILFGVMLLLGSLIFVSSWKIMHVIYK